MNNSCNHSNGEKIETSGGSIEISPIEVDASPNGTPTPARRSVQFSDKVQRFPESAPTSPKPVDASSPKDINKTPLDIAAESLKREEKDVKKVYIPIESTNGNKPQIDSFIDVKMEKQNNPDLKIEFNSPIGNSSTNFDDQQQQQSDKQKHQQNEDIFKPTTDASSSSLSLSNQPPRVNDDNSNNFGENNDEKAFVTTVILNVEMVRTPKETEPEDDWDTDCVKLSFSTNATNFVQEEQPKMQEKSNKNQSASKAEAPNATAQEKPPRSPQFGESKEGWNQIDLSPLLNTSPSNDIANINATLNRTLSVNEEEQEESKNGSPEILNNSGTRSFPSSDHSTHETQPGKKASAENATSTSSLFNDGTKTNDSKFGIMPHKAIEIPIRFNDDSPAIPLEIPLSEFGMPAETSTEIIITFETKDNSGSDEKSAASTFPQKLIEIPIHFEGQPPISKTDFPLSDFGFPAETNVEISINFISAAEGEATKRNELAGIIEIPIQFEGHPTVAKIDIPLSQFGTPPLTQHEIPIIIVASDNALKADKSDEKNAAAAIEIPIHFEGQEAPINFKDKDFSFAPETSTEIVIIFENSDNNDKAESGNSGIEIPIQFEGQPLVAKIEVPLSQHGTPPVTVIEIPIAFSSSDEINGNGKNEEDDTEIAVVQFGFTTKKPEENATALSKEEPYNSENQISDTQGLSQNTTTTLSQEEPNKFEVNETQKSGALKQNKLFEIPIQYEGQPPVQKLDVPLSEFGTPAESSTEIIIIFESPEEGSSKNDSDKNILMFKNIEIPIQHEGQPAVTKLDIPLSEFGSPAETNVEIVIIFENKKDEDEKQKPVEEDANKIDGKNDEGEEETITEIPITFEFQSKPEAENQNSKKNEDFEKNENKEIIVPLTFDQQPNEENGAKSEKENILEPNRSEQQKNLQEEPKVTQIPATAENHQPQLKQEEQAQEAPNEKAATQNDNNGIIYQTSFAKPMADDASASALKDQKNADYVPEATDVKYQETFAAPLSTEKKEEKPEEKKDSINYQSSFAKPLNDDKQENKQQENSSWSQNQTPETVIPIKIESQQPAPQKEQSKEEPNKWGSATQVPDDKIESSLFSASSPLNDEDFWIEVPPSGVVREIPISVQKSEPSSNFIQQSSTQVSNEKSPNEGSYFEKPDSTKEPPKSPQSISYNEIPTGGEQKQQQASDLNEKRADQNANSANKNDNSDRFESANSKSANASKQNDTVRSPTNKYNDSSMELNIQEYEEQLRKNTQEALNLVDKLCESSMNQQQQERKERDRERERERRSSQSPTAGDRGRSHSVQFNESQLEAQSYRVNPDLMQEPTVALLLPDHRLALADEQFGLSIFNLHTKDLKRVNGGNKWRRPHSMIYLPRSKEFLVLCEYSEKEDGNYQLFICRFNSELEYVNRVEAPAFIRDKEILTYRMTHCHRTDCLYLSASTYSTGYIYELSPEGFWREVYTGRNKHFVDISIFAVIGPVTELMLVDTIKDYIVVVSIYNSEAADNRRVAACEKPSALTIDEKGTVLIHDRFCCKVGIHSRLDNLRVHDVALVEHPKCQLSAWDRLLAVLIPSKKDLRLYKY